MRQASLNYKQHVWMRRGIRSTMEHGIRGRRAKKEKELTLISIVGGAVTCFNPEELRLAVISIHITRAQCYQAI